MSLTGQITSQGITTQISSDAITLLEQYFLWKARYQTWNENVTTAVMNALGIPAGDQAQILAVVGCFNLLIQAFEGTDAAPFNQDMRFSCSAVRGTA